MGQDHTTININTERPYIGTVTFKTFDKFPVHGCLNRIYIDASTNTLYRWDKETHEYVSVGGSTSPAPVPQYFVYVSGGTLTLPNPALPENEGLIVYLSNQGSTNAALNYPIYLDQTTTQTVLTFTHPDNKRTLLVFNNKYITL